MMASFPRFILKTRNILTRNFTKTAIKCDSSKLNSNLHKVNNLEKRFLVWTRKYKNVNDIPELVPSEVVDKARNRMRIRLANIMMVLTLVGCLFVSRRGKKQHESGDSVQKRNLEWHRQVNEETDRQKENAET